MRRDLHLRQTAHLPTLAMRLAHDHQHPHDPVLGRQMHRPFYTLQCHQQEIGHSQVLHVRLHPRRAHRDQGTLRKDGLLGSQGHNTGGIPGWRARLPHHALRRPRHMQQTVDGEGVHRACRRIGIGLHAGAQDARG